MLKTLKRTDGMNKSAQKTKSGLFWSGVLDVLRALEFPIHSAQSRCPSDLIMSDTDSETASENTESGEEDDLLFLTLCWVQHEQLMRTLVLSLVVQFATIVCIFASHSEHQTVVVNNIEKLLVSLVRNRQNRGALFVLAKAALPRVQRCAQKVQRPYATISFHPYLLRMGYKDFAERFWLTRMRMSYTTFEKLLGIVENVEHPLLARQTRMHGMGVRDDVQT
jgi:hypothetical protein